MKFSRIYGVTLQASTISALYPFTNTVRSISIQNDPTEASTLNPHELLNSISRKPEVYAKAMLELKRLEEEPICHRVAVQLLMNNCQGLEGLSDSEYQLESAHIQRHHVESFAASLAICDLERGGFIIPSACRPFTSSFLLKASQEGKGNLQVTPDQVGLCLGALGQDHSHWSTWLSYRDKAQLFCCASRLDIDKDQALMHHKKLTQIMAEFSNGLEEDLKNIKASLEEHARSAESYFDGVKLHADNIKIKLQDSVESLSSDFKEASEYVKSSLGSSIDLQRLLRTLVETVIQSNAEVAAGQEQALAVTTNQAKSQMEDLNILAGETGANIAELKASIHLLFPAIVSLSERQDALDRRSQALYESMKDMTELIQDHTESLELASSTAFSIHENLAQAAESARAWNNITRFSGSSFGDYAIRFAGPLAGVLLGNYGLPPSFNRNAMLIAGGYGFAETIVQWRHLEVIWSSWCPSWLSSSATHSPSSMTQLPNLRFTLDEPEYDECTESGYDDAGLNCSRSSL